jgi:hypothetical protein
VPPAQHTHNSRQHHKTYEELHIYDTHTYTNTHTHTHTHIKQAHYQLLASPSSTHRHPKETMRVSSSFLTTTAAALLLAFTAPGAHALDAADAKNLTEVAYIYTYPMMLTYKQMYTVRVCVCVFLYDALKRWPGYLFLPFPYLFHPFIHPKLTQTHTHTHTHLIKTTGHHLQGPSLQHLLHPGQAPRFQDGGAQCQRGLFGGHCVD